MSAADEYRKWVKLAAAARNRERWNPLNAGYADGIAETDARAQLVIAEKQATIERWKAAAEKQRDNCIKAERERDTWKLTAEHGCSLAESYKAERDEARDERAKVAEERDELTGMADAFDGLAFDALRFAVEPTDENRDALLMWNWDEGGVGYRALRAELEALRGRRCENCRLRIGDCRVTIDVPYSNQGMVGGCPEATPADFACNRWTAREEGGE